MYLENFKFITTQIALKCKNTVCGILQRVLIPEHVIARYIYFY